MPDDNTVRHEIIEERGNRDAFRLAIGILIVFAIMLITLAIAAWNSRFFFMPLMPKDATPAAPHKAYAFEGSRSATPTAGLRNSTGHVTRGVAAAVVIAEPSFSFCGPHPQHVSRVTTPAGVLMGGARRANA